jgi:predicted lipoprotein with Yx(FWY)xxD motif
MIRRLVVVLTACLVLGACDGDSAHTGSDRPTRPERSTTAAPREQPTTTATPGTEIVVADSKFGPMLFDQRKQAIYLFDIETTDRPKCYGDCADAWPPVLTDGAPIAGDAVKGSLLGTTQRSDGTVQVTYGGHPLYYYAHEKPGEVKCHDVFLNGGTWYVVKPDGNRA